MTEKEQQIAEEQLNKCIEWVAYNLVTTCQKPTKQQLQKMRNECRLIGENL